MKRLGLFLTLALLVTLLASVTVNGATEEKKDKELLVPCDIDYEFAATKVTAAKNAVSVLVFANINADVSYFMLDDISNSQWAEDSTVDITAVDITGADESVLELYRNGLTREAIDLVSGTGHEKLAGQMAKKAGLKASTLTYPFTVIIDEDQCIRYAIEGYRSPDVLKKYVQSTVVAPPVPEAVTGVCTEEGTAIVSWGKEPMADGYSLYRAESKNGIYEEIFSTATSDQNARLDSGLTNKRTYYYTVRSFLTRADGKTYSEYSEPVSVKLSDTPPVKQTVTKKGNADITVSWSPVKAATSYTVYRFATASGPLLAKLEVSAKRPLEIQDHGGEDYYYVIRANLY